MKPHNLFNNKILGVTVLLLIIIGIAVIGCGNGNRILSPQEAADALVGSWQRRYTITFTSYTVVMAFNKDGSYNSSWLDNNFSDVPVRKFGSYLVLGNTLRIVETGSEGVAGTPTRTYNLTFSISDDGRKLTLSGDYGFGIDGEYNRF